MFNCIFTDSAKIQAALPLLSHTDVLKRQEAATTLGLLGSRSIRNQDKIREQGGIPLFVALLSDIDTIVQERALLALHNLVLNNPLNQAVLRQNGTLDVLERLKHTDNRTTIQQLAQQIITACPKTFTGHTKAVTALAVLRSGELVSASADKTIKLWNSTTGACERTLTGHTDDVCALAVLPNGYLVSGSCDGLIKIWYTATGACVQILTEERPTVSPVFALIVLPSGELASTVIRGYMGINIWNVSTGKCVSNLSVHGTFHILALAVLASGELAAGLAYDGTIKIFKRYQASESWDDNTGGRTLTGHTDHISALVALVNDQLASGSLDKTIKIWNSATGECVHTLKGHTREVNALTVLPRGELVSGSDDKTIKIWNSATGECVRTLTGHNQAVMALTVLPSGELVSASADNTIKAWDLGFRPAAAVAAVSESLTSNNEAGLKSTVPAVDAAQIFAFFQTERVIGKDGVTASEKCRRK